MPFFKRSEKTAERIEACQERLKEIAEEIAVAEAKIEAKKGEVSGLLGRIATDNKDADRLNLQSARKVLGKMNSEHQDLLEQRQFLQKEIVILGKELQKARLRDLPKEMEKEVSAFNATLEEAVSALETLETLHKKLYETHVKFRDMGVERDAALSSLGVIEGLNLPEGFGRLSRAPNAWRSDVMVPDRFSGQFIDQLLMYRQKVAQFEEFQKANPSYAEDLERTRKMDSENAADAGRMILPRRWQF